ncbi:lysosomal alpha-glucosidase-like [Dermacentor albipictus]|uniref:lysosomal alpha-glucosidase-like n=1 Tax=Dermacentor albipictus TaxID=60249 RepID=UPI0031FBCC06
MEVYRRSRAFTRVAGPPRQYRPAYRAGVAAIVRYSIRRNLINFCLITLIGVLGFLMVIQRPVRSLIRAPARVAPWLRPADSRSRACTSVDVEGRFDCHPDVGLSRVSCERRGCCFHEPKADAVGVPACYFPAEYYGYKLTHRRESSSAVLKTLMRRVRPSGFPEDASEIEVAASLYAPAIARLTVTSSEDMYRTSVPSVTDQHEATSRLITVFTTKVGDVVVYRPGDRQILFETDLSRLVYTPRFVQLVTLVPTTKLYGLGESRGPLERDIVHPHVGFNRDLRTLNDSTHFFHGSHPFYMGFDRLGTSFGVYFRTSAIFEVLGHRTPALTFRSLGNQVDVFVFGGPSPADVVRQYLDVVGRPAMPPFWAMGLHASLPRMPARPDQGALDDSDDGDPLRALLTNSNYHVDVAWLPVDVTKDTCEHAWHRETMNRRPWQRLVHTLVPTLSERPSATFVCRLALAEANYLGLLLVNQNQELLEDEVLEANITSYVLDFAFPRYDLYLNKVFSQIYPRTPFDGLWLDRNEPTLATASPPGGCARDGWDVIPYTPKTLLSRGPLDARTLCMSQHLVSGPHLVGHNAVPYFQAQAAYNAFAKISGQRPFVVSRSSYSGIGKFAGHVIHGLRPTWEDLRLSIPMLLSASLLGMPLSGAEVCGGEEFKMASLADEELCVTWFSLAVFYPLLRLSKAELFLLHPSPFSNDFLSETSDMLDIRLSLRPYLYYLFYRSHVAGDTVVRPLFVEFPDDTATRNISDQFLWGSALMIIPFLVPNKHFRRAHIPEGVWYNFDSGAGAASPPLISERGGGSQTLQRRGNRRVLLLLRGGHVLPVSATPPAAMRDGRSTDYSLRVALDEQYRAEGSLYCDDGVSAGSYEIGVYGLADIVFHKETLLVIPRHVGFPCGLVREVRFVGLPPHPPEMATLDGLPVTLFTHQNQTVITNLALPLDKTSKLVLQWRSLPVGLYPAADFGSRVTGVAPTPRSVSSDPIPTPVSGASTPSL